MYVAGFGRPLVVIPGVHGRWEWFRPTLDALATRCQVTSYSLCGDFGSGWAADPAVGFENYLHQLDTVVERTGRRVAVCGVSYGGAIALRYAATRPERVSALLLASAPAPGWSPNPVQRGYIDRPWRGAPRFVLSSPMRIWPELCATFDNPVDRLRFLLRHGLRAASAPMIPALMARRIVEQQRIDFRPDCATVRCPTLVITGEPHLDRIVPVESTRRYVALIPGAKYVMLERTGHLGLLTRPSAFAGVVTDFLDARETSGESEYRRRIS